MSRMTARAGSRPYSTESQTKYTSSRTAHGEEPVRQKPEGPGERHALEVAEEERRVAERGEEAADVRDQEDEEDDRVRDARALAIGLEDRGGSGASPPRSVPRKDARTLPVARNVALTSGVARRSPRQADAAGDDVQRGQQQHERDVLLGRLQERVRMRARRRAPPRGDSARTRGRACSGSIPTSAGIQSGHTAIASSIATNGATVYRRAGRREHRSPSVCWSPRAPATHLAALA